MTQNCFRKPDTDSWLVYRGDSSIVFLNGSCLRSPYVVWNMQLMKIWSVKITHENWNWMKNWLSMNSTLRIFSKTNSSSWLWIFLSWAQNRCSRMSAYFSRLNNQNVTLIEIQKKMEEFGEKMKSHVSKISPGSRASFYPSGETMSHNEF